MIGIADELVGDQGDAARTQRRSGAWPAVGDLLPGPLGQLPAGRGGPAAGSSTGGLPGARGGKQGGMDDR